MTTNCTFYDNFESNRTGLIVERFTSRTKRVIETIIDGRKSCTDNLRLPQKKLLDLINQFLKVIFFKLYHYHHKMLFTELLLEVANFLFRRPLFKFLMSAFHCPIMSDRTRSPSAIPSPQTAEVGCRYHKCLELRL